MAKELDGKRLLRSEMFHSPDLCCGGRKHFAEKSSHSTQHISEANCGGLWEFIGPRKSW